MSGAGGLRTVMVTDASRGSAVATIRALARSGHSVIAADSKRMSAGCWSRHATHSVRYPDPERYPRQAAAALLEAVARHDVNVLVPVTDAVIGCVELAADRWPAGCRVTMASAEQLDMARHKATTLDIARSVGVPIPGSILARDVDAALAAGEQLGWPVVLKPERSTDHSEHGAQVKLDVSYAHNGRELRDRMARYGPRPVLVQEFCHGQGEGVELLTVDGRILAAFQHRRLREVPFSGGVSSLRESVALDPTLFRHSSALLAAMRWTGLAMVEFKCGPNGPKLMEVNGRMWGSMPLAVKAGVDFPTALVNLFDHCAHGTPPQDGYKLGVRSRNLRLEVLWAAAVLTGRAKHPILPPPERREAMRVLARLANPADGYDIMSWRDPAPALAEILQLVAKCVPGFGGSHG